MAKFLPGQSGNPTGRKPGPNKATIEGRELARELVSNPAYRKQLRERLLAGKLPPAVEVALWAYAFGRPPEQLTIIEEPSERSEDIRARVEAKLAAFVMSIPPEPPPATPPGGAPPAASHDRELLAEGRVIELPEEPPPAAAPPAAPLTRVPPPDEPPAVLVRPPEPMSLADRLAATRQRSIRLWR